MSEQRVCIATRDPYSYGGSAAMAKATYQAATTAGYDPFLIANRLDRVAEVRLQDLPRGDWNRKIEHTTWEGMELVRLPRYLPEFEFLQYVSNGHLWKKYIESAEIHMGVAGKNFCCYPFARSGVPFASWTATLFWEDRRNRLQSQSLARRLRDHASRPVLRRIERQVFLNASPPLALSDYTARRITEQYDIGRESVQTVRYPLNTNLFSPSGEVHDDGQDGHRLLFVGRFGDERKNTSLLIRSLARLQERGRDISLQLVGDEPTQSLTNLADRLGVRENVTFVEFVPRNELPAYYRAGDVFVIPSWQEGLCIAGLEAMGCGLPIVTTACGGPEEYVVDGENGYVVGLDDGSAMADRIDDVLSRPDGGRTLGDRSRELAEDRYARGVVRSQMVRILERLESE